VRTPVTSKHAGHARGVLVGGSASLHLGNGLGHTSGARAFRTMRDVPHQPVRAACLELAATILRSWLQPWFRNILELGTAIFPEEVCPKYTLLFGPGYSASESGRRSVAYRTSAAAGVIC